MTTPGKRKATKKPAVSSRSRISTAAPALPPATGQHAGGRRNLFPGLPSAPTLVGAAALALAAVGATVSQQSADLASDGYTKFASQASVLNSASSIGSSDALAGRERAVSRDSQRQALADAATAELEAAAESQAEQRNATLAALAASAERYASRIAANQWQLPLPAGSYRFSARFGECSSLWANCHTGLDMPAPFGTPVFAVADGVVTEAGYDGSYGYKTVIRHEDGTETWYAHQAQIIVSAGDTVRAGQQIGMVGSTGNSTGSHLHLEVRPGAGDAVDPIAALRVRGLTL